MTLATGKQLGPHEILTTLGVGGMGEVYRAPIALEGSGWLWCRLCPQRTRTTAIHDFLDSFDAR